MSIKLTVTYTISNIEVDDNTGEYSINGIPFDFMKECILPTESHLLKYRPEGKSDFKFSFEKEIPTV